MSQETVDYFNDMKESQALERRQRRAIRQADIQAVKARGYAVSVLNGGLHIQIRRLDYWPSTGNWRNHAKGTCGNLKDGEPLLVLVQRELGEPGPVIAKKLAERASA